MRKRRPALKIPIQVLIRPLGATPNNSKVGPYVSVGSETLIEGSEIENTIIQQNTIIKDAILVNSMIGNHVLYTGQKETKEVSIGDFSEQI